VKTCTECLWFETFKKRGDEQWGTGCRASGWEGYVPDPAIPECGGVAFVQITAPVATTTEKERT
jgi:hypothetical protein